MRYALFFALGFFPTLNCFAQPAKPDWVAAYEAGKALQDVRPAAVNLYWGIGASEKSQEEADQMARREFVRNVSAKVDVTAFLSVDELKGNLKEKFQLRVTEVSSARLSGISISERWAGPGKFYSLISIPKDDYDRQFEEEMRREISRMRVEAERELAETQIALEKQRKQAELEAERDRIRQLKKEKREAQYGPFYSKPVPTRMVNVLTAAGANEIMVKAAPNLHQSGTLFAAKKWWVLHSWVQFNARRDFELNDAEFGLRAVLVDGAKAGHGLTASIGAVAYAVVKDRFKAIAFGDLENSATSGYSPTFSATYGLPEVFFSHANFTADRRRASLGWNARPFYDAGKLGESVEVLFQADALFNRNYRFRETERLLFHTGLRINTGSRFSSVIAFENHRRFMVTLEFR